jgi:hypothetical protein
MGFRRPGMQRSKDARRRVLPVGGGAQGTLLPTWSYWRNIDRDRRVRRDERRYQSVDPTTTRKGTPSMEPRDFLFFEKMLTPKVITFVYWLLIVACVLGGLGTMFTTSFWAGLGILLFGTLAVRIYCELLMVLFKMNEALQSIRNRP